VSALAPAPAGHEHRWKYTGQCYRDHPDCQRPYWLACVTCGERRVARCDRTARHKCKGCAERYRRRVKRVFASGWCDNPTKRVVMLTVTAPGTEAHTLRNGDRCPCTPDGGVQPALFNALAGSQFNRLMQDLRRRYGDIQYCRAAEVQRRGVLHFHILMRVERLDALLCDYDRRNPHCRLRRLVEHHGFGHELDVRTVEANMAWYCAKYVSKACDDRAHLPWLDRTSGEILLGNGRYRPWTASRRWGATMASIRATQAQWVREQAAAADAGAAPAAEAAASAAALEHNTHHYTYENAVWLLKRELRGAIVGRGSSLR
jgi:hypothetical protein